MHFTPCRLTRAGPQNTMFREMNYFIKKWYCFPVSDNIAGTVLIWNFQVLFDTKAFTNSTAYQKPADLSTGLLCPNLCSHGTNTDLRVLWWLRIYAEVDG